jgi:hypothetical protein
MQQYIPQIIACSPGISRTAGDEACHMSEQQCAVLAGICCCHRLCCAAGILGCVCSLGLLCWAICRCCTTVTFAWVLLFCAACAAAGRAAQPTADAIRVCWLRGKCSKRRGCCCAVRQQLIWRRIAAQCCQQVTSNRATVHSWTHLQHPTGSSRLVSVACTGLQVAAVLQSSNCAHRIESAACIQ